MRRCRRVYIDSEGERNGSGAVMHDQYRTGRDETNLRRRNTMTPKLCATKLSSTLFLALGPATALILMLAAAPALAHWPNTNLTKWLQGPDPTNGIDLLVGQVTTQCQPIILADDFQCRQSGYISDIHIWTSWTNNYPSWNLPITLCFWSDVKAVTNGTTRIPSHPGTIIWCQTFFPEQYTVEHWRTAYELFCSPNPHCPRFGSDTRC